MLNYIVERKAASAGFRNEIIGEFAQILFAIATAERSFFRLGTDERADAPAGFHDARALQLGIDFRHRVRIDAQIHRQLAHGRKLLADPQLAGGNREPDRALELGVEGRRMIGVYMEHRLVSLLYYDNSTSWVSGFQPDRLEKTKGLRPLPP